MVLKGVDRLTRHCRDGLRSDQFIDVERVSKAWVLGRCRRPQASLRGRPARSQCFPALAAEQLLVLLVGELGIGDSEAAFEIVTADLTETVVGLGVDSGDEEAGDRVNAARVAPGGDESFEP